MGECYFRVAKHLQTDMVEVIRKKFHPEIKMLLNKYYQVVVAEQKEIEEMEKERANMN